MDRDEIGLNEVKRRPGRKVSGGAPFSCREENILRCRRTLALPHGHESVA